jgi:hypothetical protein
MCTSGSKSWGWAAVFSATIFEMAEPLEVVLARL